MMETAPLKFRSHKQGILFGSDAGDFFISDETFLERLATDRMRNGDTGFLQDVGLWFHRDDFTETSYLRRFGARHTAHKKMNYVIMVPTLRCDLACSYCQVSRAAISAKGFDWTEADLEDVLKFLDGLPGPDIKIEFQGGEPTVRMDLLQTVADFARKRFETCEFVVCTNLQNLPSSLVEFIEADDVHVSTSLDGTVAAHQRNRTKTKGQTDAFFDNLRTIIDRFPEGKVSALPTIDPHSGIDLDMLMETYKSFGFRSVFLRPVNYQGFARKRFAESRDETERWLKLYFEFIDLAIDTTADTGIALDEFYFKLCLRRFLQPGVSGHVDLRNPNFMAQDYIVIDHDVRLYPTDEARMLTRSGQIDLSIGTACTGVELDRITVLNEAAINSFHEDCIHCPYQAVCGVDLVDDLSRYGRVDSIKSDTVFCRQQLAIFDRIVTDLTSEDDRNRRVYEKWLALPAGALDNAIPFHDPA